MVKYAMIVVALMMSVTTMAKELKISPSYYTFPMEGAKRLYSATFGEMRPDHFHSGVDIKSDGVEGKRIVAAADGYISRIALSPGGFGLALYIAHPNGTTTVYAHLKSFRADIAKYVEQKRYELKQHSVNLYPEAGLFKVKRGETIGLSGNSGSSAGPHLHYELRDSGNQKPLNAVKLGLIKPKDRIRPTMRMLYYIEFDERDGVRYYSGIARYPLVKVSTGEYRIKGRNLIWTGRKGIFIIAATDYKADVWNKFGIYRLRGMADGKCFFEYEQNGFTFDMTRYSNAVNYYPLQIESSDELYRMARIEGSPRSFYKELINDGVLTTKVGEQHKIVITAEDDMKNISTLRFTMRGKDDKDCYKVPSSKLSKRIVRSAEGGIFTDGALTLTLPKGALYESIPYRYSAVAAPRAKLPKGVKMYGTMGHKVLDYTIPLHKYCPMSLKVDIPAQEQPHVTMAYVTRKGAIVPAGGVYKDGKINCSIRSGGVYFALSDLEPPTITTELQDGAKVVAAEVSFTVKDNFSGVSRYKATLDGEWIALDLCRGVLTHRFRSKGDGRNHTLELEVCDGCGNKSVVTRRFVR